MLAISLSPDVTDDDRGATGSVDAIPASAAPVTQRRQRKRKYSPAHAEQRHGDVTIGETAMVHRRAEAGGAECERIKS